MSPPEKPKESLDRRLTRSLRPAALIIGAGRLVVAVLRLLRLVALRVLEVLAALILLFEEWGWRPLAEALARLRRLKLWARFEDWIGTLPPYPALLVFLLPSLVLLPLKLAALWLIANGQMLLAGVLFVGAKVVGTAFVARLFLLLQPKLMAIWWFARLYGLVMPWKEALFAAIRASWAWRYGRIVKARVKRLAAAAWARWKPELVAAWARLKPRLAEAATALRARAIALWRRIGAR